jgi:hypothetical protein
VWYTGAEIAGGSGLCGTVNLWYTYRSQRSCLLWEKGLMLSRNRRIDPECSRNFDRLLSGRGYSRTCNPPLPSTRPSSGHSVLHVVRGVGAWSILFTWLGSKPKTGDLCSGREGSCVCTALVRIHKNVSAFTLPSVCWFTIG